MLLGGRYQVQDPIGCSGMATTYRGHDLLMNRVVAIKILNEKYCTDPQYVTRFQCETQIIAGLNDPNIVQVYDYGQTNGIYFIVMELIEGTDLRRYSRSRGVLKIDRAIVITHAVALGLGAAHCRSIVHRDVKPQNVLVRRDASIKLTGFWSALMFTDLTFTNLAPLWSASEDLLPYNIHYYAPERAQGKMVNPAADVYALGSVMYELLTGRTPFDGNTPVEVVMRHIQDPPLPPSQLNPDIPAPVEEIILRCLEKVPEMRYSDGLQLARALESLGKML